MKYECGCGYKTGNHHGYAGHFKGKGHKEWLARQEGTPEELIPGVPATDRAGELLLDAFLSRLEGLKKERDEASAQVVELRGYRTEYFRLEKELKKEKEEKERVLKRRNERTISGNKKERIQKVLG